MDEAGFAKEALVEGDAFEFHRGKITHVEEGFLEGELEEAGVTLGEIGADEFAVFEDHVFKTCIGEIWEVEFAVLECAIKKFFADEVAAVKGEVFEGLVFVTGFRECWHLV